MPHRLSARSMVCILWLLNSMIGARVAIREDLPGEFAGMTRWHDPSADFFRGGGTALSPGLPMMAAQAVFTVYVLLGAIVRGVEHRPRSTSMRLSLRSPIHPTS